MYAKLPLFHGWCIAFIADPAMLDRRARARPRAACARIPPVSTTDKDPLSSLKPCQRIGGPLHSAALARLKLLRSHSMASDASSGRSSAKRVTSRCNGRWKRRAALPRPRPGPVLPGREGRQVVPHRCAGHTRVVQWCFAALSTVERPLMGIPLIDKFCWAGDAEKRRAEMVNAANRRSMDSSADWGAVTGWLAPT